MRQPERAPARSLRYSPKHPTGMFWMGSPCGPWHRPGGLSSSKRLSPFVTKRPAVPCPGCRPRHRAQGFQLSFFLSKRKLDKEKCALRKSVSPVATGDQRRRLWKPPPFGKGGRKLYRPSALLTKTPGTDYRLSARLSPQRGRVGRDTGGTPAAFCSFFFFRKKKKEFIMRSGS